MPAYKTDKGTWYVSFYYRDINGKNTKKKKTGFPSRREALEWERSFLNKNSGSMNMSFAEFVEVYTADMKPRLRYNTWITKEHVIQQKILPYFGARPMSDIEPADIIKWQNTMINYRRPDGSGYSDTYLRTIHNQLSAIFNHAVRFYGLPTNPVRKAGGMGKDHAKEMRVWTKDEYLRFAEAIKTNKDAFYAFEVLYWCGIRIGELLALTKQDFDLEAGTLTINKSFQRLGKENFITPPKTEKSNRVITIPRFLCNEMDKYFHSRKKYRLKPDKRIFTMSKSFLHAEMARGAEAAGLEKIRIHDLRHSHVSLLISMGFNAVDIAGRLGHEGIDITLHYAHMFPSRQMEMSERLNLENPHST